MTKPSLGQKKIEHAVLWSVVTESYDSFVGVTAVKRHLLDAGSAQQIHAALQHLTECGFLENRSAALQDHFEPTRKGMLKIESLTRVKSSFVGRLSEQGPVWLSSPEAISADLQSQIEPDTVKPVEAVAEHSIANISIVNTSAPNITSNVTPAITSNVNPSITSNNTSPDNDPEANRLAASGARAGWVNALVAVVVGAVVVAVTVWVAGKF
jgi:hypothetical protein